jgi:H+-translocating NAD(P) transhydrogenase subunit alpha
MDEAFYRRQRELLTEVIREQDVLITTAAVPGRKAPILVTRDMVLAMQPGSVIVDIAAERGGNCEVTRPGETIVQQGISVLGPLNVPSMVPFTPARCMRQQHCSFVKLMFKRRRAEHQSRRRNHSRNAGHARRQDCASAWF